MPRSMRRRDFLIATAASGAAYATAPSARLLGREPFAEPDPNFHVYLAFGQSNMEGFPGIEPQDKVGADKRFQMLAAGGLYQPRPKGGRVVRCDSATLPQFYGSLPGRLFWPYDGGGHAGEV